MKAQRLSRVRENADLLETSTARASCNKFFLPRQQYVKMVWQ